MDFHHPPREGYPAFNRSWNLFRRHGGLMIVRVQVVPSSGTLHRDVSPREVNCPMANKKLIAAYQKLNPAERHMVQLCAFAIRPLQRGDLAKFLAKAGWKDSAGKQYTQKAIGQIARTLEVAGMLQRASYDGVETANEIADLVMQDSIRRGQFDELRGIFEQKESRYGSYRYGYGRRLPDLRIAFYAGEVSEFQSLLKGVGQYEEVRLFDPFSPDIFATLDPVLQQWYFTDRMPQIILSPAGDAEVLAAFDQWAAAQPVLSNETAGLWLDLAMARGDLKSLAELDARTGHKLPEAEGCEALLRGDFERAERCLAQAAPAAGRKGKRKSGPAAAHLPLLLYLMLLFKRGTAESLVLARSLVNSTTKAGKAKNPYSSAFEPIAAAIAFRQSPTSPGPFAEQLNKLRTSSLAMLLIGYLHRWFLADEQEKVKSPANDLASVARAYRSAGLAWLEAEAAGLASRLSGKNAASAATRSSEIHARLGTVSLVNLIEPEPTWQRSLNAIGQLGEDKPTVATTGDAPIESERLIWEISATDDYFNLQPFLQKRKAKGWTTGRRVGLQRLYDEWNTTAFAFLTDQDRDLCRTLEMHVQRNYHSYTETYYLFNTERTARAIVGHPCVFSPGDRETPLEIVEQPPRLVVAKQSSHTIRLKLDPKLPEGVIDNEHPYRLIKDGPQRIILVFFDTPHLKLQRILGRMLDVPAAAAEQVVASIQKVSSLVAVHSEIGGDSVAAESVAGDARPHLHLLPYQGGLRAEFFVRPFGDDGPFCRPGQGEVNVFASFDGQPRTAHRDLAEERSRLEALSVDCLALSAQTEGDTACFPSPIEALEALLELEDQVAENRVVLHWPQGRSLQLAGRASGSQLQMSIRRDRDWFAASGKLKVDQSLAIDMMKLIDLVEASPSRFVQLDDGRFLALTDQLRQRVQELGAYGDRQKTKLRFPPVRAVALEDLGEAVKLKADASWIGFLNKMKTAGEVPPAVPSTLQAELRDYQTEGFHWMARLAEWGMGGCLADDMGLGKTVEALALLVHRAAGGPTLVVAPTSVGFNWLSEANRFAPTLNARLFGPGDRGEFFRNLGPRDVAICSYGLMYTEAARFQAQTWHTVVLDEAQAIKNMATRRSQAAMGLNADFRLIMTGTPLENHLGELWNLFQFINPGLLGSLEHFQQRFAAPIERDGCQLTRRRLKKLIQPFLLRRTKIQVLAELPSRTELTLQVELSKEEATLYEALRCRALEKLAEAGNDRAQHLKILAEIMRLRRACCHPKLVVPESGISGSKLALFSETIDELLDNHHKALVFSQFVDHLTILREELDRKGVSYQYLDGGTPAAQRKKRVEAFQSGEGDVFLISLRAGGLGLNLTAADYVLHMDPWWNPAVEDQASDRAHRLGQQRPVTIYRFITKGTIEERITDLHASKRDLADSLLEGTHLSGKLTAEQLLKLIRE